MQTQSDPHRSLFIEARFPNVEMLHAQVRLWNLDFRPLSAHFDPIGAGRFMQVGAGDFIYGHCGLNASFDQFGSAPPGVVTFVVKSRSTGRVWWRNLDTEDDDILVYFPGSEVRCINGPGFSVHTISVNWEVLERLCQSMKLRLPPAEALRETISVAPAKVADLRMVLRLVRANKAYRAASLLSWVVETLLWPWLAQANTSTHSRPPKRSRDRAIRNCLELLDAGDLATVEVAGLREISDVGERTLQYAFLERFAMTPQAFLRSCRLSRVRNQLRSRHDEAQPIGALAAVQGLWHHGHFTAQYKKLFGETPSQTRANAMLQTHGPG